MTEDESEHADDTEHDHADEEHDHDHADEGTEGGEEPEEGLQHGDFVRIEYTARTVESDQLVDTTDEAVAEEEGVDTQGQSFGPRTIVLGEGGLFGPVDDDIVGREAGESATVTVPAAEAFGEHDPDEVRTISAEKIPEDDRYPGANVQIDGDQGFVETVIGGRARVDFNHPLAGQDVEYDYEIVEQVEDRVEQAKGLFSMYVDVDLEMWIQTDEVEEEVTVDPDEDETEADADDEDDEDGETEPPEPTTEVQTVEKETLYIEATPQLSMNQQWMFSKQQVAQQVMQKLGLDRVIVQETIDGGGMGGMMGGMGGMMGGMGGEAPDEADVEEIVEELE
jgi:FKBP-type peptidyl-prolyl cis-trans isomerase SlyD